MVWVLQTSQNAQFLATFHLYGVTLQKYFRLGGWNDCRIKVCDCQRGMLRKLGMLIVEYVDCVHEMGLLRH